MRSYRVLHYISPYPHRNQPLEERLREVRALVGFTRVASPGDYEDPGGILPDIRAAQSRKAPRRVPASELRGEGIFLHFKEVLVEERSGRRTRHDRDFFEAHKRWRTARGLPEPKKGYPGLRFVLLHSLAHALIRQLSRECRYTAASLRERIYSRGPGRADGRGADLHGGIRSQIGSTVQIEIPYGPSMLDSEEIIQRRLIHRPADAVRFGDPQVLIGSSGKSSDSRN